MLLGQVSTRAQQPGRWESMANPYVFSQQLLEALESDGYESVHRELANEAYRAYKLNRASSQRLLYTFLWVDLLNRNEKQWVDRWYQRMSDAQRMRNDFSWECKTSDRLEKHLSHDAMLYLFSHPEWAERVYLQIEDVDFMPRFLEIISELYGKNKYAFEHYPQLAFAIALVHDYQPPHYWPHPQVSQTVLPRELREPGWVFDFLTDRTRTSRQLKLENISLLQSIFLVDICLSDEDIEWVNKNVELNWFELEKLYTNIKYDVERPQNNRMQWSHPDYRLETIYKQGGICVDQAYFASQVTKAFGIPSLLFLGQGLSGRHAWFGYLDVNQDWALDGGRYAAQRFVTGFAINPQTWEFINDHRLEEITTGLYEEHRKSRAQLHMTWASSFDHMGYTEEAEQAWTTASRLDRENLDIWLSFVDFRRRHAANAQQMKACYRSAIYALGNKADLEHEMSNHFIDYLESVGDKTAAENERRRIIQKYQSTRGDIALAKAGDTLRASLDKDSIQGQWLVYQRLLYQLEGEGIGVLDTVIEPFVKKMRSYHQYKIAQQAIELAWQRMAPEEESQFARELKKLQSGER